MNSYITRFLILILALMPACIDEIPDETFFQDNELTITAFLERNVEDYSMMLELLERAGFKSAFNAYGTYTLFVFKNDAFQEYLQKNSFNSVSDMSVADARILVRYHGFRSVIHSSNLGLGRLPVNNMEDDVIVSSFDETGLQGIIINREARIIQRDIELSNGTVHVLNHTLTPIVRSVIEKLEYYGNYSIFVEAARVTGFYNLLNRVYDTLPTGDVNRIYYTLLAESDDVFRAEGINSLADLQVRLDNGVNNPKLSDDSLNMFIANHIIPGRAIFIKDFQTGNYQSYYGQLINMVVDRDFRINPHGSVQNPEFITFLGDNIDFQAKNGVAHTVNKVLNIFFPEPVEVIWEFNDQPVVGSLWRATGQDSEKYTNLELFPNMSGTVSAVYGHYPWGDDGGRYYGFLSRDALIFDGPSWDVTFKMPIKIVQGRYRLYVGYKDGSGRATIQVLVNGIPIGEPLAMTGGTWYLVEKLVGEVNLPETTENEIRIVTVVNGQGQLDYLRFEPI